MPSSSQGSLGGRSARLRQPAAPKLPVTLSSAKLPDDDLKDDGVYLSLEYADIELAKRDAVSVEIDQCRYKNVNFGQTELDRALISDSVFGGCDLANLRARDCSLVRVALSGNRMTGLSWAEGSVRDTTFESCRMDMVSFRFSVLKSVIFSDCKLMQADFQEADLRSARFERCDLSGTQFSGAKMEGTRFSGCILDGINGVTSLRGSIVKSQDALALTYSLASALGIKIEDD
jgi:uncharacterized protein YjbI with pentapeptide repeats